MSDNQPSPIDEIKPPERIYLQTGMDDGDDPYDWTDVCQYEVSWCADRIDDSDIEYVIATSHAQLQQENERLAAKLELARNLMNAAIPAEECVRGCSNGGQPNQGDALVISTQLAFAIRSFATLDGIKEK